MTKLESLPALRARALHLADRLATQTQALATALSLPLPPGSPRRLVLLAAASGIETTRAELVAAETELHQREGGH